VLRRYKKLKATCHLARPSGVTYNPAIEGHFRSGQWKPAKKDRLSLPRPAADAVAVARRSTGQTSGPPSVDIFPELNRKALSRNRVLHLKA